MRYDVSARGASARMRARRWGAVRACMANVPANDVMRFSHIQKLRRPPFLTRRSYPAHFSQVPFLTTLCKYGNLLQQRPPSRRCGVVRGALGPRAFPAPAPSAGVALTRARASSQSARQLPVVAREQAGHVISPSSLLLVTARCCDGAGTLLRSAASRRRRHALPRVVAVQRCGLLRAACSVLS